MPEFQMQDPMQRGRSVVQWRLRVQDILIQRQRPLRRLQHKVHRRTIVRARQMCHHACHLFFGVRAMRWRLQEEGHIRFGSLALRQVQCEVLRYDQALQERNLR
ncbi:unnamed protein product [Cercospora beticola]|nr:unnamed protein product [Cercospora beticola]